MASTLHIAGLALEADWVEAWGTWIGGLGTIGTLAYAIVALRREADRRREDIRSLRDAERDSQDAQARSIVLGFGTCSGREYIGIDDCYMTLGNYGEHSITNVSADLQVRKESPGIGQVTHLPPDRRIHSANGGPIRYPVVKAGEEKRLSWKVTPYNIVWPTGIEPYRLVESIFEVEIQFTDVHGIRRSLRSGLGQQPSRMYDRD